MLSDCRSAALVGVDGSIDWWCPDRFDAPAVFARLLGPEAGHWSIRPAVEYRSRREYVGRSLVLRTVFQTATGSVAVIDALALDPDMRGHDIGKRAPRTLVRLVEGLSGTVAVRMCWSPRFDYGRSVPHLSEVDGAVRAAVGPATLLLSCDVPLRCEDDTVTAQFDIGAGQQVGFTLAYTRTYGATAAARLDPARALAGTTEAWESWAQLHTSYVGEYAEQVQRSAIVLQGLTYQPSGAVVAAPTTSLPERLGGEDNYDYRYAWLRDFTLTMRALWVAACPDEADALFAWVARSVGRVGPDPVPIMYGVEGERDLTERTLEHLAGFAGSRPVRVGNEAWRQRQLDVLGEVLDAACLLRDKLVPFDGALQALLTGLAEQAAQDWRRPDAGMWEARDTERHYLSSKVLCWVALDRAVTLAPDLNAGAEAERWAAARDEIRREILARGWNEAVGAYTGAFDSDQLDASVLILPLVGFLPATDPRMRATIDAIEHALGDGGLIRRWSADPAGFLLCGFWLSECLALAGETEQATVWFERTAGHANDLGLFAEQADPSTRASLGNFPQAFSHVGLINAAWRITQTNPGRQGPGTP
jgi:GH15 family glucan-1,4-alpha-glucosidase